jgi:hypothetical protein
LNRTRYLPAVRLEVLKKSAQKNHPKVAFEKIRDLDIANWTSASREYREKLPRHVPRYGVPQQAKIFAAFFSGYAEAHLGCP